MYLRSLISAALCALAFGCSDDSGAATSGLASEFTRPRLELLAEAAALLPGETVALRVRYLDAAGQPVPDAPVDFGLSGGASGASLTPAQALTDVSGEAQSTLRAGSTLSSFTVRASTSHSDVEPVFFRVEVKGPESPTASVAVSYAGKRSIVSRSVTLVPAMSCAVLEKVKKEDGRTGTSFVLFLPDERALFNLGSGLAYAVYAWGSDDDNGKLAYGCTDIAPLITADAAKAKQAVVVTLEDTKLGIAPGAFDVSFSLDVSLPLAALNTSAEQAVLARLPKKMQPGAAFYLDALEATFGTLGEERAGLDQELQTLLDQANGGPLEFGSRMAQLVAAQGSQATLQATLNLSAQDTPSALAVSRVDAVSTDLARTLPMLGALSARTAMIARYDPERAVIVLEALSVQLGLGSYATWLLDQNGNGSELVTLLAPSHGCAQVSLLVTRHPALPVTAVQAEKACQQAASTLAGTVRTAWQMLDADHMYLWFQGSIPVHDRDLDSTLGPLDLRGVDDIGPAELSASWSLDMFSAAPEDGVGATLRVPPTAALAL